MQIKSEELRKEKKILEKVTTLMDDTLSSLKEDVKETSDDFKEFQKLAWNDFHSLDSGEMAQVVSMSSIEENKIMQKQNYYKRLKQITKKPYFASIVFKDEEGEIYNIYIALTYLKDEHSNNILYDWRSPICSLFYDYETGKCSYKAPGGIISGTLKRKRQYKIENSKLLGVFDNSLNIDDEVLQDVLLKDADSKMQNVVNTIQEEQNKVIRNTENHNLIVQGIAGSGKTTVALHRIAYLLYQIKDLRSNNILIFSPNNIFTEYISEVLPSLGEANTLQTTFNDYLSFFISEYKDIEYYTDFVKRYYSYTELNKDLVKYKQSDAIIRDIENYLDDYVKNCEFVSDFTEGIKNYVDHDELNELLHYKYDRMPLFERVDQIAEKLSSNFYKGTMKKKATFNKLLMKNANFTKDYKEIYKNFFTSQYCQVKVSEKEVRTFINNKVLNYEDALIFAYIKGKLEGFPYEGNIKQVVIDEAQDYNRLEYIIINEIFKKASFTILGDINQNINPYYEYKSLNDLAILFKEDTKYIELLKTYRSSPEIINYTNKILNLNHVNAIRKSNNVPILFRNNDNLKEDLLKDLEYLKTKYKSCAIITKDDNEALKIYKLIQKEIDISLVDLDTKDFKRDFVIIPAYIAKGLEFDSVIIYNNPANTYRVNERHLLYVACTRCQHELIIYK